MAGDDFLGGYQVAADLREKRRQFDLEQGIRERDAAVREAALRRLQEQQDWQDFAGPAAGLEKTPYGGAAATDIGTIRNLFETRHGPAEPDMPPGTQGPPTLDTLRGRQDALAAARAGVEAKTGALFDTRYRYPADRRYDASVYGADSRLEGTKYAADQGYAGKVDSAGVTAGAKEAAAADKERQSVAKQWSDLVKRTNPQTATIRAVFGQNQALAARAGRGLVAIERQGRDPTPQEAVEDVLALVGVIQGGGSGGQVALRLVEHMYPKTAISEVANLAQYAKNAPQSAQAQEFAKRWTNTLIGERDFALEQVRQGIYNEFLGNPDVVRKTPVAPKWLKNVGLTDDQIKSILEAGLPEQQGGGPQQGGGRGAKILMNVPPGKLPEMPQGGQMYVYPDEVPAAEADEWTRVIVGGP